MWMPACLIAATVALPSQDERALRTRKVDGCRITLVHCLKAWGP